MPKPRMVPGSFSHRWYFDARQFNTAQSYFTEALRFAREIGDRPFIANVLACLSLRATMREAFGRASAHLQEFRRLLKPYRGHTRAEELVDRITGSAR
ncbi:hypothetical protein ACFVYP_31850 [Kitasatospora sp. NPDC058201]|uniref:hypothetical protein n=1 Tax=unclassified Kitasatospora TaxID=2633591 RepID=UPI00365DADD5